MSMRKLIAYYAVTLVATALLGFALASTAADSKAARPLLFLCIVAPAAFTFIYISILHSGLRNPIRRMLHELEGRPGSPGGNMYSRYAGGMRDLENAVRTASAELFTLNAEIIALRNEIENTINSISDAILVVDRSRKVIIANEAASEILGIDRTRLTTRPLIETFWNKRATDEISRAFETAGPRESEIELDPITKRTILFSVFPFRAGAPGFDRVVITIRDITESKQRELVRTQFIENASHELRTPVALIRGFIETLVGGAIDDPGVSRRFLELLDRESARLAQLTEDILSLERAEKNVRPETSSVTDAVSELSECAAAFEGQASARSLRLVTDLPDPPVFIEIPKEDFRRIFVNLIDNAMKFTDEGTVSVTAKTGADSILITVEDTGDGIPPQHLDRIFERFYRVDKSRSREKGGTGLGLSIVKHLVEDFGGTVSVESVPGKGSIFKVSFPISPMQKI